MVVSQLVEGGLGSSQNVYITIAIVFVLVTMSYFTKVLDISGVISAAILGLIVGALGHWSWLVILLIFLTTSHLATHWSWDEKVRLGITESDDGHRSWQNVVYNGAIPGTIAIIAFIVKDWTFTYPLFTVAVAVATADTWASEFGCVDPRVRFITDSSPCAQGTNGGYSRTGQIAAFCGAGLISLSAIIIGWIPATGNLGYGLWIATITTIIGWIGCQIDSLIGAMMENRGWISKGGVNNAAIFSGVLITTLVLLISDY